jgi:hypothetical protein
MTLTLGTPGAPNLIASSGSLAVIWGTVSNATSYNVYCNTEETPPISPTKTVTGISTTITGLINDTRYYVWIESANAGGKKLGPSSEKTLPPVAPTEVSAVAISSSSIIVSWDTVTSATGYYVYRATSAETYDKITASAVTDLSYTDTGRTASVKYYYTVAGTNSIGEGAQSTYVFATTMLTAPQNLAVTQRTTSSISLSWGAVSNANSYKVYYGVANSFDAAQQYQTISNNRCTITGLIEGCRYYMWVTAHNSETYSAPSLSMQAETVDLNIDIVLFQDPSDPVLLFNGRTMPSNIRISQVQRDSHVISVEPDEWEINKWLLDGQERSTDDSCTIDWQIPVGPHTLTVFVTKDDVRYSASINFTVVNR